MIDCIQENGDISNARKNIVTALLKQNIEFTVFGDLEDRLAMVDKEDRGGAEIRASDGSGSVNRIWI